LSNAEVREAGTSDHAYGFDWYEGPGVVPPTAEEFEELEETQVWRILTRADWIGCWNRVVPPLFETDLTFEHGVGRSPWLFSPATVKSSRMSTYLTRALADQSKEKPALRVTFCDSAGEVTIPIVASHKVRNRAQFLNWSPEVAAALDLRVATTTAIQELRSVPRIRVFPGMASSIVDFDDELCHF